jgi:hypothetical protein
MSRKVHRLRHNRRRLRSSLLLRRRSENLRRTGSNRGGKKRAGLPAEKHKQRRTVSIQRSSVPAFVENDYAYKQALEFMKNVGSKPGAEYEWVFDYAKTLWSYRNSTFVLLDEKADSIIKYLGGGTGLFTLGVLAKVDGSNWYIAVAAMPAIACALLAILFAILARMPGAFPGISTIETAKDYADAEVSSSAALAGFLGQWNLACEAARLICARKANRVAIAAWLTYSALVLLALPLLVAVHWPPTVLPTPSASPTLPH